MKTLSLLLALVLLTPLAWAQEMDRNFLDAATEVRANLETRQEARTENRMIQAENRAELRADLELQQTEEREARQAERQNRVEIREDAQATRVEEREAKREDKRLQAEARRAEFQERRAEKQASIQERMNNRLELTQERRAENRSRFSAQAQSRITNQVQNLNRRYQSNLDTSIDLYTRLESRINTMSDEGFDMNESLSLLSKANLLIEAATNNVVEAEVTSEVVLDANDANVIWAEARSEYTEAKEALQEIKLTLRQALAAAKDAQASAFIETDLEANQN